MQQRSQKQEEITLPLLQRYHSELNQLYENNINLRMKYPTEPLRFYQTQQQIDNTLQSLMEITQQNIPILIQSKILVSILKILNHPNSDINMSCIQFLHQIISEQPQDDQVFEVYYRMCVWLTENGLFQGLVETILKMKEEENVEEYEIALKILKIIETLTQQVQQSIEPLITQTKILEYLSNRIMPNYIVKHKVIDDNKYVGSDLLAFLLSNSEQAQLRFHELCGMEILLQSIRPYLSKTPQSSDQQEYLGNLFSCLNFLLINPRQELAKSRHIYHEMQGNSIMLQIVKQKNQFSVSALKALANSFNKLEPISEQIIVENFIEQGGLKYIFPVIMRQGLKSKDIDEQMVIDDNCLTLILIMIRSASEIHKIRVEAKLSQKRFQKLQKIFQIRTEYMQNMGKQALKEVNTEEYIGKLKEGLGVVEIVDKIICLLIFSSSTIKQKLIVLMRLYGVTPQDIQFILKTKYTFIGQGYEKIQLQKIISESLPAIKTQIIKAQQKNQ